MKTPTRIEPGSPGKLAITWDSGERFETLYTELRYLCPCAVCVDETTGSRVIRRDDVRSDVRPLGIVPIGNYAIRVEWSDAHSSGMFHFDTLAEICLKNRSKP